MSAPAHWPEYAIEACCLGLFMLSATGCTIALQHPHSPLTPWVTSTMVGRLPLGLAMGVTLASLVYSPLGRRSGAHMNPVVTLTFYRLGKIETADAIAYMAAQFVGGAAGMVLAILLFGRLAADPTVNYVATMPGPGGSAVAFVAEAGISFLMMLTVLLVSNTARLASFTGVAAAVLVAGFITFEAPLSGMSMNPARTVASALFAHSSSLWIYFTAPLLGMLGAAELFVRAAGRARIRCAKLFHPVDIPCIFQCGYSGPAEAGDAGPAEAGRYMETSA
jgi:aquaporin Z